MLDSPHIKTLNDVSVTNKRVCLRADLNTPLKNGVVSDDSRIQAILPTLKQLLSQSASVIILSHLGRPTEGVFDDAYSLAPVAKQLGEALGQPVRLVKDYLSGVTLSPGEVVLAENVRFNVGEAENDHALAKQYAQLADVCVMDAFATAHRSQASTVGLVAQSACACAGPLLYDELTAITQALSQPQSPMLAIVGGSKVSTKLEVLQYLLPKADVLIPGGGIANTLLAAAGCPMGASLYEPDQLPMAKQLLDDARAQHCEVILPVDVLVSDTMDDQSITEIVLPSMVGEHQRILDIGPKTAALFAARIATAGTVLWNGPVGVFELLPFANGTRVLAEAIADSAAKSIAGGGDTLAAVHQFAVADSIDLLSTGGGAFLDLLAGKPLPVVRALLQHTECP